MKKSYNKTKHPRPLGAGAGGGASVLSASEQKRTEQAEFTEQEKDKYSDGAKDIQKYNIPVPIYWDEWDAFEKG